MEALEVASLIISTGTLAAVVKLIFMLGRSEEKHVSHDRRLTKLERKSC